MRPLAATLLAAAALASSTPERRAELPRVTLVESQPTQTGLDHEDIDDFSDVWRSAIESAEQHIELAHFYASDAGELGATDPAHPTRLTPIITALEAAAGRGVTVRWLADAQFAKTYPALLERFSAQANFEVREYWMPSLEHVEPGLGEGPARDLIRPRSGPAQEGQPRAGVMHAKYMLVDDREVIFGSANFDWRSLEHIQELGCWIRDEAEPHPLAAAFGAIFDVDWFFAGRTEAAAKDMQLADFGLGAPLELSEPGERRRPGSYGVRFGDDDGEAPSMRVTPLFSPRGLLPDPALWDLPQLVASIDAAKSRVLVQVLTYRAAGYHDYFGQLDGALRRAAARGVEVELLVADWGKRRSVLPGLKSLAVMPHIDVRFVNIPEASDGHIPFARVIHSKYMVVDDDLAWIGTANWERSYFESGRNVGLLFDGQAPAARLARFFGDLWSSDYAEPVDPGRDYEVPDFGERGK